MNSVIIIQTLSPQVTIELLQVSFISLSQIFSHVGLVTKRSAQVELVVKNPSANSDDVRDADLIPRSGRYPGGGRGSPLQYSCREKPMDREAWWATFHVAMSQT